MASSSPGIWVVVNRIQTLTMIERIITTMRYQAAMARVAPWSSAVMTACRFPSIDILTGGRIVLSTWTLAGSFQKPRAGSAIMTAELGDAAIVRRRGDYKSKRTERRSKAARRRWTSWCAASDYGNVIIGSTELFSPTRLRYRTVVPHGWNAVPWSPSLPQPWE